MSTRGEAVLVESSLDIAAGAGYLENPDPNRAYHLKNCNSLLCQVEASLDDERLDLWGEYELVGDDDILNIIIPMLSKAAWKTLDLRRSVVTSRGIQALAKALILCQSSSVKTLCLGSMGLNDAGLATISKFLPQLRLDSLILFDNSIGDAGVAALCAKLPESNLKVLNLCNNDISDEGAVQLSKIMHRTRLQRLLINANNLTSFGVDQLIESYKHSSLAYIGMRGNSRMLASSRAHMGYLMYVTASDWYRQCITLFSAKAVPRLGHRSNLQKLPSELLRQIMETLGSPLIVDDSFMNVLDEADDQEDRDGLQEDFFAALSHLNRSEQCHTGNSMELLDMQALLPDDFDDKTTTSLEA